MRIMGDSEGVSLYFNGELEIGLLLSLLERHINLCVRESLCTKGIFQENREIHPTEHLAKTILDAFTKKETNE